jgi:two-component system LytT family response regulator
MIRALIVDDEKPARLVLRSLIEEFTTEVAIVGECPNVPEAVIAINTHKPDVVFLDIEMPEYSGFELLSFFNEPNFEIIFVTAYSEYAIRAFEVSAVDYILKPIEISDLEKAIAKLKDKLTASSMQERLEALKANLEEDRIKKMVIPMTDGLKFIKIPDIAFIQAKGAYAEINFKDQTKLLTSKVLRFFEQTLEPETDFVRIHRSSLVNISFVSSYNKGKAEVILENGVSLAVSNSKKSILEKVKSKKII